MRWRKQLVPPSAGDPVLEALKRQYTSTPTGVFEQDPAQGDLEGLMFMAFGAEAQWDASARPLRPDWWEWGRWAPGVQLGGAAVPSVEVVLGYLGGPGSGKTSLLAEILALWPWSAIVVSSKPDIAALTAPRRSRLGRTLWLDWAGTPPPQPNMEQARWSLLDGATSPTVVAARVSSLLEAVELGGAQRDKPIWIGGARTLLSAYILAAGLKGLAVERVLDWMTQEVMSGEPVDIIQESSSGARFGRDLLALQSRAHETVAGFFATARPAVQALSDDRVLASMTDPNLVASDFLSELGSTLYVCDPSGESDVSPNAPLTVALLSRLTSEARRLALATPAHPHHPRGRLCPPCLVILDEVANTTPMALSRLLSQSREVGPVVWAAQSWSQLVARWQEAGAQAIWDHSNVKMLGSGVGDAAWLGSISELLGESREWVPSLSASGERSHSQQSRPAVPVEELARIPRGAALMITGEGWEWVKTPPFAAIEPFKTWASDPVLTAEDRAEWERETGCTLSIAEVHRRVEAVMETVGAVVEERDSPAPGTPTLAGTVNPFPWGQCTWWAYHNNPVPGVAGDAWQWVDTADPKVIRISPESLPPVWGLVVYRAGLPYGPPGHVALVEAVHYGPGGGVVGYQVSEANMRPGRLALRDVPWPDPNVVAFLPPAGQWKSYKPQPAPVEPEASEAAAEEALAGVAVDGE